MDVALYRRFQKEPSLTDLHDFVVVDSQIHDQFDHFRDSTQLKGEYSLVPVCELLIFYCASQCSQLLRSKVVKYGNVYLELHYSEVDKLVFWVEEMREKYYGLEGEEIFKDAAQIMFHENQAGKRVQVNNLYTSLYHTLAIMPRCRYEFYL